MSLQKKQVQKSWKRDIFFIVHFSRQTNGGVWTPKTPPYLALGKQKWFGRWRAVK